MSAESLRVEKLTKSFAGAKGEPTVILDGLDLTIEAGETVAVVGPSGSGKSTLLNLIGSLEPPTSGRVLLGDLEVTALAGEALAQYRSRRVGFIFQEHHLLPQLTAEENVLLPTLAGRGIAKAASSEEETKPRGTGVSPASDLIERVGLSARQDAFPAQLSGGERQRVAIARALINSPSLLLCDEPTGNLDRETGAQVVSLLLQLAAEQQVTVIMVTHNLEQARRFGRVLELSGGKLLPAGAAQ